MPDTTLTGPYINYGRSLPVTLKLGLGGNIWIVGVKDTTRLKIVKIQITGPTTYNWIGTRWHTSNGACIASFTKDCFKGTELSSDKYPVSLQAVEAKFAKLDGDWVIVEDHFFVDKRRQGQVWSFNSELGVFDGNAITQTGENTFTTKSDLIYQYEYYPDMVQDGGATRYNKDMIKWWYNQPSSKYFWFARQAPEPTKAPASAKVAGEIFDRADADKSGQLDRSEFKKILDAGKIKEGPSAPVPPTVPTTAPVPPPASSTVPTQAQKDALLRKHNDLRAAMGASDMTMMVWDDTLANAAQTYASGCPSGHSKNRPNSVGENLAWKWSSSVRSLTATTDFTPSVQSWYDEIKDAGSYKTGGTFSGFGKCSGVCGHYTQVVRAAANKLGCGVNFCPHSSGMGGYMLVCQYGTSVSGSYGGNMQGTTLFTSGKACSKCPSGFQKCASNLCSIGV